MNTTHILDNGFCTVCGETEEWITANGQVSVPATADTTTRVSTIRNMRIAQLRQYAKSQGHKVTGLRRPELLDLLGA